MNKITLDKVPLNTKANICRLECAENIKRRLLDLGMIAGTEIIPVLKSPIGNLVAYQIRGTLIALRQDDTSSVYVYI